MAVVVKKPADPPAQAAIMPPTPQAAAALGGNEVYQNKEYDR